jgi:hypothetical protein
MKIKFILPFFLITGKMAIAACSGISGNYYVGTGKIGDVGANTEPFYYVEVKFGTCSDLMYFSDKGMLSTLLAAKSIGSDVLVSYCSGCTGGVTKTFANNVSVSNRVDFVTVK